MMGVERADRAVEFAEKLLRINGLELSPKPMREYGDFLAHRARAGRLPMRPRQQRRIRT